MEGKDRKYQEMSGNGTENGRKCVKMGLEMVGNDRTYEETSGNGTGNGRK